MHQENSPYKSLTVPELRIEKAMQSYKAPKLKRIAPTGYPPLIFICFLGQEQGAPAK